MKQKDVIEFFDRLAPRWDADMIRSDAVIARILDGAGVTEGRDVLDVACGTGVLFPDYLARKVASVTAVDIAPEMVKIAGGKYPGENITVLCGDVETMKFDKQFDCVMVYNAFPHFPEPARLIETLSGLLKAGGTLTIAHGMSRAAIDHHHEGTASRVSVGLMSEHALAALFRRHLKLTVKISDDTMYQVTGQKM
ncbi:MAG: class I SAM-dependent methyltransferase [Oscillospiraceae bacterium]|nr:class I SAM-dependent methyltransferase [Oscillospiraceae bacterium]